MTGTAARIEDHAMLGNCRSAALVDSHGTIDWLCLPRFDSDAVFAALLGNEEHGCWKLAPTADYRSHRRYRDGSLVLETTFETEGGSAQLLDFMVTSHDEEVHTHLVRIVRCTRGSVELCMRVRLRFNYGHSVPWVTQIEDGIQAICGPDRITLRTPLALTGHDLATEVAFTLEAGTHTWFVLGHGLSHQELPPPLEPMRALHDTETFWRRWSTRCHDVGPWAEQVKRSLVVLKGLSYLPTGAIVASPTTSLPERLGGERNWDYRYCWLRDSVFTLVALITAGYHDEATAFRDWLRRTVAGSPEQLQALYGVGGERRLLEWSVPWLPGFEGSQPVRIGNAALAQFQLDVYGELIGAFHYAHQKGVPPPQAGDGLLTVYLEQLEARWQEPDEGIWEIRDERRHFVHSKVMAWLAFDCGARDGFGEAVPEQRQRWRALADRIHAEVLAQGVHPDGYFVQSYGSDRLDAACLLVPLVGFLPPHDPRVAATADAIVQRLSVDGLVQRYRADDEADGLSPGEGVFLACSFWLVDNYTLLGRLGEARTLFERLVGLCNDVGLLAEEYDPRSGRMLGNFPQGYSHVALVNSALRLHGALGEQERHP